MRDVAQQLISGPAVAHLPENVWQRDGKRDHAAEPNPFLCKMAVLRCEQKRNEDAATEESHRMFILETEPGKHAEPQPESVRTAVDDAHEQINASHPEEWLERVHGKEIAVGQKHERAKRRRAAKRDRPVAPAQRARDRAVERDRCRAC